MTVRYVDESRGYSCAFGRRGVQLRIEIDTEQILTVDVSPLKKLSQLRISSFNNSVVSAAVVADSAPTFTLDLGAPKTGTLFVEAIGL